MEVRGIKGLHIYLWLPISVSHISEIPVIPADV